jgi:hypothetical protein
MVGRYSIALLDNDVTMDEVGSASTSREPKEQSKQWMKKGSLV